MNDRKKNTEPLLVSFSGIDGAGKTTQISNLCERLRDADLKFRLITFWDDIAAFKRIREGAGHKLFKGDQGVGSPEVPIERKDKNVQSPLMTLFRLAIYCADALSLRRMARKASRCEVDVVIFDRYLYDELANLNLANPAIRSYVRTIMRLVPRPAVSFIIDANPDQARVRKPEYPLDFLHANRNSYLHLSYILSGVTVVPPATLDEMKTEVVEAVFSHVVSRHSGGLALKERDNLFRAEA